MPFKRIICTSPTVEPSNTWSNVISSALNQVAIVKSPESVIAGENLKKPLDSPRRLAVPNFFTFVLVTTDPLRVIVLAYELESVKVVPLSAPSMCSNKRTLRPSLLAPGVNVVAGVTHATPALDPTPSVLAPGANVVAGVIHATPRLGPLFAPPGVNVVAGVTHATPSL